MLDVTIAQYNHIYKWVCFFGFIVLLCVLSALRDNRKQPADGSDAPPLPMDFHHSGLHSDGAIVFGILGIFGIPLLGYTHDLMMIPTDIVFIGSGILGCIRLKWPKKIFTTTERGIIFGDNKALANWNEIESIEIISVHGGKTTSYPVALKPINPDIFFEHQPYLKRRRIKTKWGPNSPYRDWIILTLTTREASPQQLVDWLNQYCIHYNEPNAL